MNDDLRNQERTSIPFSMYGEPIYRYEETPGGRRFSAGRAHREAETYASQAEHILAQGNPEEARELYARAAICERWAFEQTPRERQRTRSILAVSLIALMYKGGQYDTVLLETERLLHLEDIADWAKDQIRELFADAEEYLHQIRSIEATQQESTFDSDVKTSAVDPNARGQALENAIAGVWPHICRMISRYTKRSCTITWEQYSADPTSAPDAQRIFLHAGMIGVLRALRADRYNTKYKAAGYSYIAPYILVEIMRELCDTAGISREARRYFSTVLRARLELLHELGSEPPYVEIFRRVKQTAPRIQEEHVRSIIDLRTSMQESTDHDTDILAEIAQESNIQEDRFAYDDLLGGIAPHNQVTTVLILTALLLADQNSWDRIRQSIDSGTRDDWPLIRAAYRLENYAPMEWAQVLEELRPWMQSGPGDPITRLQRNFYRYREYLRRGNKKSVGP